MRSATRCARRSRILRAPAQDERRLGAVRPARFTTCAATIEDHAGYAALESDSTRVDRGSRCCAARLVLSRDSAGSAYARRIDRIARQRTCAEGSTDGEPRAPGGHREAVRHRPATARELNRACTKSLGRAADLPHRPLPRQGDGAEHHGLPLRQLRSSSRSGTGITSTTCRSPRRKRSASRTAAATTRRRAWCATCFRTICCSCSADGDGAAGRLRGRRRARREGQGARSAVRPMAPEKSRRRRCAANTGRHDRRSAGVGYREEPGVARIRRP